MDYPIPYYYINRDLHFLNEFIQTLPANMDVILAGGAIRAYFANEKPKDYDLFFNNEEAFQHMVNLFDKEKVITPNQFVTETTQSDYNRVFTSDNAYTYIHKPTNTVIQLIKKIFGIPEDIISKFDITACMGAFSFKTRSFVLDKRFIYDIAARRINFAKDLKYPFATMCRALKYQEKGYRLSYIDLMVVLLQCHKVKCETLYDWKEQLLGVDVQYLSELFESIEAEKKAEHNKEDVSDIQVSTKDMLELILSHIDFVSIADNSIL